MDVYMSDVLEKLGCAASRVLIASRLQGPGIGNLQKNLPPTSVHHTGWH